MKRHEEAMHKLKDNHNEAQKAEALAMAAAEQERIRLQEISVSEYNTTMNARTNEFTKLYRNVWATGETGVSFMQMTIESRDLAEKLISNLFYKTLIADVQDINHVYQRVYTKDGAMQTDLDVHKLVFITADDRVAEAIEEINTFFVTRKIKLYPAFDLVVTPLATGSKEYITWVKTQTLAKSPELAFYNK